ncbi:hypothetical protein PV327_006913 [Microctonus hyperodae]|uniref:Endonuclease/exonuclease/phosphatase domain-containing protein n=1 Tax=Microctonus hyperodae TaxID=165561 RepID=A0AA39F599_MICHY|nr:hypothetical protein PV327_006913 [Microctonus hyperodae]
MIAIARLLTTINPTRAVIFRRHVHVITFQQQLRIFHMSEIPVKHLLLGNFRRCTTVALASYSTFNKNLLENKINSGVKKNFNYTTMDPFLEMCLAQPDTTDNLNDAIGENYTDDIKLNVNSLAQKHHYGMTRRRYKDIRQWKSIEQESTTINVDTDFILRILSYNILAQNLLETHSYIYKHHNFDALDWNIRKVLVQQEIIEAGANVICIQEMQKAHLHEFLVPFLKDGYDYLYKKRTNDTEDGLLLLYRNNQLKLEDYEFVEYHQTSSDILNRDNVGIVVKFSLKDNPNTYVVISTTHLLYNPKRNDVRLAQTQILFSELERIAFNKNTKNGPKYHPIILCGDFNLQPFTGVYKFITEGSFEYSGKGRSLEASGFRRLSNSLIPSSLCITDNCQHFNVLAKRLRGFGTNKVMLKRSESGSDKSKKKNDLDSCSANEEVDINSTQYQKIKIIDGQYAAFASGAITHPFKLNSVYKHVNHKGEMEATTHQDEWITVDYIFFTDVEPLNHYALPTVSECQTLPLIPNFVVGSDHLCLGATFKLKKKNSTR